jgi:MoxR-like ATPase
VSGFLDRLGIVGWGALEPVLLAALALEAPLLLVGPHGTAKSLLIERLAGALALGFRHYNASLLSYDDLVGIPMPDETGTALRFVGTPAAIWGTGFVFIDELSRCRPDLQNKLFPVIHERRVAGVELPELRHRWAAMNPPAPEEGDGTGADPVYLGSEALDPALADRFAFVVRVPGWREFAPEDRLRLVAGKGDAPPAERAAGGGESPLRDLVSRCAEEQRQVEARAGAQIAEYVVQLVDLLGQADLAVSPRRARMLSRGVAAVHAARRVLSGQEADLEESAELALRNGLPQTAEEAPPGLLALRAAHRQAWEVAALPSEDPMRAVLAEPDRGRRVAKGAQLGLATGDLSRLATQSLSNEPCDARRIGLATAIFLGLNESRSLTPAAWEVLAQLARRVLEPRVRGEHIAPGRDLETWREISRHLARHKQDGRRARLERSFLLSGFPDLWRSASWHSALVRFGKDLDAFGVPS